MLARFDPAGTCFPRCWGTHILMHCVHPVYATNDGVRSLFRQGDVVLVNGGGGPINDFSVLYLTIVFIMSFFLWGL